VDAVRSRRFFRWLEDGGNGNPQSVGDFVGSLGPISAASRLIERGVRISLERNNSVLIPRRQGGKPATDISWVVEAAPIMVKQHTLDAATLGPTKKLACIVTATRELVQHSDGEQVFSTLLREDVAASLDASLFSTTAADSSRPAGILAGLSSLTPATSPQGSGTQAEMIWADLANLANAVVDAGGSGEIVYIAAPKQANAIRLWLGQTRPVEVWSCPALANKTVVAIQPDAFASAFGSVANISIERDTALHLSTTPLQLGTVGSPNVVAAPVSSLFQQDLVAVKCILDCAWTLRAPLVSFVANVNW